MPQAKRSAGRQKGKELLRFDFEGPDALEGWRYGHTSYSTGPDTSVAHSGKASVRIASPKKRKPNEFGPTVRSHPAEDLRGKWVSLSGYIKTKDVSGGRAGFWMRMDRAKEGQEDPDMLELDNMQDRGPEGTTRWKRYEIVMQVPEEATSIVFGMLLVGSGTAWFDDVVLEEVPGPEVTLRLPEPRKLTAAESRAAGAWLKSNAIAFRTAKPGGSHKDLMPLKDIIGDAHIVALGEGTHGTREFFQMKHRITEFLATEMGFTIFAIEANMPETQRANDFVLGGEGEPGEILDGMYFWTWNTEEVRDLMLWMREYNASGRGRMEFLGFDMQTATVALDIVADFVRRHDKGYRSEFGQLEELIRRVAGRYGRPEASSDNVLGWRAAKAAEALVQHLANLPVRGKTAAKRDWALQNARIAWQQISSGVGLTSRDYCMAENAEWMLGQAAPGTKIVLWAHNGHVARTGFSMGYHLAQWHGDDLRVIGFACGEGTYTAWHKEKGLCTNKLTPPRKGSLEWRCRRTGLPRFMLDLRGAAASPAACWLAERISHRAIGAMAVDDCFFWSLPNARYDALIYFDKTTHSRLLHKTERR